MWICPKCGREFQRQNQGHYCENAPVDVDDYIAAQEEKYQEHLRELVRLIRETIPDCSESIKWSMPSFQRGTRAIQFAACKNWISLYAGANAIEIFHDSLEGLKYKKDALYLPYDRPLPEELVKQIIGWKLLKEKDS